MPEENTVADTGDLAAEFAKVMERQTSIMGEMAARIETLETWQAIASVTMSNLLAAAEGQSGALKEFAAQVSKLIAPRVPAPKTKPNLN